mmetsp:Transcript_62883/g.149915  ORF Transcript_62883/g.149915 Transcript_62883/m.149915 type:complete len:164 (+) Transcript_62883:63-554(+)
MRKLPKVKNKCPAQSVISVQDLLPKQMVAGRRGELLSEAAASVAMYYPPGASGCARLTKLEEEIELAGFRQDQSEMRGSGSRLRSNAPSQALHKSASDPGSVKRHAQRKEVRAVLRPRKGRDWMRRRLLHLALRKEDPDTCPMARIRRGFGSAFVPYVFAFLQ